MIGSATSTAISGIQTNFGALGKLADKISNPDSVADAGDIVAFKQAANATEINVAVLKKIIDTSRSVDLIV